MNTTHVIGIDIAKDSFDAARHGSSQVEHHANHPRTIRAWLASLPTECVLAMESTGTYHETLADLAVQAGFIVYVLNPQDVAHYRKSIGARAKTDRVDALLIARYVAREQADLHPYCPASEPHRRAVRLLHRRAQIVKAQIALRQSSREMEDLKSAMLSIINQMELLLQKIDRRLIRLMALSHESSECVRRLRTISGVGPLTAAALTLSYERHPFAHVDAFIAYLGMDPRVRESGTYRGRCVLSKRGDGEIRRLLYCVGQSAMRMPLWKPFYEEQIAKGRKHVEAVMILARRIAKTAFSLLRHKCDFDPERVRRACATP